MVAAVSVGIVDREPVLDLDYPEDSTAQVDRNVVATEAGHFIEVQGTPKAIPSGETSWMNSSSSPSRGLAPWSGLRRPRWVLDDGPHIMDLVLATRSTHKLKEIRKILAVVPTFGCWTHRGRRFVRRCRGGSGAARIRSRRMLPPRPRIFRISPGYRRWRTIPESRSTYSTVLLESGPSDSRRTGAFRASPWIRPTTSMFSHHSGTPPPRSGPAVTCASRF